MEPCPVKSSSSRRGSGSPGKGQAHPVVICSARWAGTAAAGVRVGSPGQTWVLVGACGTELGAVGAEARLGGGWLSPWCPPCPGAGQEPAFRRGDSLKFEETLSTCPQMSGGEAGCAPAGGPAGVPGAGEELPSPSGGAADSAPGASCWACQGLGMRLDRRPSRCVTDKRKP